MSNMPKSFEFTEDMVNEVQALNKKPSMLQGDWIKELQFELNKLTPSFSEAVINASSKSFTESPSM